MAAVRGCQDYYGLDNAFTDLMYLFEDHHTDYVGQLNEDPKVVADFLRRQLKRMTDGRQTD